MGAKLCCGNENYNRNAVLFVKDTSEVCYKLYNQIADATFSLSEYEDLSSIVNKIKTVKLIGYELVQISAQANEYDLNKIRDPNIKMAIQNFKRVGELFILEEEYFSSVLVTKSSLKEMAKLKNIVRFEKSDNRQLSYFPDLHLIYQTTTDPNELMYYWSTWREKNLIWASMGFYTIVESIKKAAKLLNIPVLEFWYRTQSDVKVFEQMESVMAELREPFQEVHAFLRNQLYHKYGAKVIDTNGPIPAHFYEQIITQVWTYNSLIEDYFPLSDLRDCSESLTKVNAKELIIIAAQFFLSLGFSPLDRNFWKHRLKEHEDSQYMFFCETDVFDLTSRVYMKYCRVVDFPTYMTNYLHMARVFYAKEKQDLPFCFFNSYNIEYSVGEAVILSVTTEKHIIDIGLDSKFQNKEKHFLNRIVRLGIEKLFTISLNFVHNKVMHDLLIGDILMDEVNQYYWKLMEEYCGVEPPNNRKYGLLDFQYEFYIDVEKNQYTRTFVGDVLGFQFYKAFYTKCRDEEPLQNFDFYGNRSIGDDLRAMMQLGSTKPWKEVISKILDKPELSGDALLEYLTPMINWVKAQNRQTHVKVGWNKTNRKVF